MDTRFSALFDRVFDLNGMDILHYHTLHYYMGMYLEREEEKGSCPSDEQFTETMNYFYDCLAKKIGQVSFEPLVAWACTR